MINLARAITTAGVAVAVGLVAVPSASAVVKEAPKTVAAKASAEAKKSAKSQSAAQAQGSRPLTVNVYYVMHDGRVVSEQGPGDNAAHQVASSSGGIDMQTQNESVNTGDLKAEADGRQSGSPVTFEVEGSEQDTGEVS
ncbi:hypothetical protein [Streptomyces winkii]|uniref:hypothetical protein n=1 Tax=Streptomyces winkii TaxID=3051178 RepID=UPI0028D08925|nr:hypothetical protein [Streptomyces sp. DSM 40971]